MECATPSDVFIYREYGSDTSTLEVYLHERSAAIVNAARHPPALIPAGHTGGIMALSWSDVALTPVDVERCGSLLTGDWAPIPQHAGNLQRRIPLSPQSVYRLVLP
jgi:hypothetical protein